MANTNSKKIVRLSGSSKETPQRKVDEELDSAEKPKKSLISRLLRWVLRQIKKFLIFIKNNWIKTIVVLAIVVGLGWFANEYMNTKNQIKNLTNPKTSGQTEIQIIVSDVSRVIDLPADEEPTLATVNDITKLKDQSFFKNAQNGDKVLIYVKAGKALLFRPVENKVIEYSNVNLQGNQDNQSTNTELPATNNTKQ